ncbi:MAG: cytochrome c biogenesis CcdA family protein [Promethearchaeota archaeon]
MDIFTYFLAFWGGIISFFTPCSIVTIPTFIAFVGIESVSVSVSMKRGFMLSIVFGLGFSILYTIIGTAIIFIPHFWLSPNLVQFIGGIVIILMGILLLVGIFKPSKKVIGTSKNIKAVDKTLKAEQNNLNPNSEKSVLNENQTNGKKKVKYSMAFMLGLSQSASAFGCTGPIFGTVLTAIWSSPELGPAFFALFLYTVGLMIPFIIIGLSLGKINEFFIIKLARFSAKLEKILGLILIIFGFIYLWDAAAKLGFV